MSAQPIIAMSSEASLMQVLQSPGVQRIYVHDYAAVDVPTLKRLEGPAAHCYAERAVVMAQARDIVVTHGSVDSDYLRYLDQIGIGPGREGIVDVSRSHCDGHVSQSILAQLAIDGDALEAVAERVDDATTVVLSPYFASPSLEEVRSRLAHRLQRPVTAEANASAAQIANRKDTVRDAAKSLGVPVPEGEICRIADDRSTDEFLKAIARHVRATGSVMLRGSWSMHGVDNLVVEDGPDAEETVRHWLARRAHIGTYLVESRLPLTASPNVQMYVFADGSVAHLATTNQRLDASSAYVGSEYPHATAVEELMKHSFTLGGWLSSVGYRGFLGIDFIETNDRRTGRSAYHLAEVNGRINGATYGLALAERINQVRTASRQRPFPAWITNTELSVRARSFAELADHIGDLMYVGPRSVSGVVPYTIALLRHGGAHAAILASTLDEAKAIECEVAARVR